METGSETFPIKPLRFHHWSICDHCIVNMDHHCPWVNNWVGLKNQRYFLLFLFYLWVSSIYVGGLLYHWSGHPYYRNYATEWNVLMGLHIGLFVAMSFFNWWQWYLCLKGIPQIEYMQTMFADAYSDSTTGYGCKSWLDNLYVTFGTKNLLKIPLPSLRPLPLNGLEWTASKIQLRQSM